MGTVDYMSPEQVRSEEVDQHSDLFSFGSILYEMLVGQRAFHHNSMAETMAAVLKEEPPMLAELIVLAQGGKSRSRKATPCSHVGGIMGRQC